MQSRRFRVLRAAARRPRLGNKWNLKAILISALIILSIIWVSFLLKTTDLINANNAKVIMDGIKGPLHRTANSKMSQNQSQRSQAVLQPLNQSLLSIYPPIINYPSLLGDSNLTEPARSELRTSQRTVQDGPASEAEMQLPMMRWRYTLSETITFELEQVMQQCVHSHFFSRPPTAALCGLHRVPDLRASTTTSSPRPLKF